jgi:hypothetical protein
MPEIGLGIGRCLLNDDPLEREVLSWYDASGKRYLSEAEAQHQRAEQLADRLRQLGEEV